jgi:uncharacterized protein
MASSDAALAAARRAPESGIRRWLVDHPVTSFFFLAFAGTWICQLPMIVSADGLALFQFRVPFPLFVALFLLSSYAGPTLGAVVVTNVLEGRPGLARFFRRYALWRVGVIPYLFVLFGFPILWLVAISTQLGAATLQALAANPLSFLTTYLPGVLIFPAIIQWGEEPGWRGFALTRLQVRYHPLLAALTVGLLHGLWHLPNFLMTAGPTAAGPFSLVNFAANIAVIMCVTIIFSWVFNFARQSILIAVLIHASFNATGIWLNGIMKIPPASAYVLYGLYGLLALAIVIATRGQLGYRKVPAAPAALAVEHASPE